VITELKKILSAEKDLPYRKRPRGVFVLRAQNESWLSENK
jgi:hypothetical protein